MFAKVIDIRCDNDDGESTNGHSNVFVGVNGRVSQFDVDSCYISNGSSGDSNKKNQPNQW